jgi:hypothetical protein
VWLDLYSRNCSRILDCPLAFQACQSGVCGCNTNFGLVGDDCSQLTSVSRVAVAANLVSAISLSAAFAWVLYHFIRVQSKTQFKHLFDPGFVTISTSLAACVLLVARLGLLSAAIVGYDVPKVTYVITFAVLEGFGLCLLQVSTMNIALLWLQALQRTSGEGHSPSRASMVVRRASAVVGTLLDSMGVDVGQARHVLVLVSVLHIAVSATVVMLQVRTSREIFWWLLYAWQLVAGLMVTLLYSYGAHVLRVKATNARTSVRHSDSRWPRWCRWWCCDTASAPSGTQLAKILPPIIRTARLLVAAFGVFFVFSVAGFCTFKADWQEAAWICTVGMHLSLAIIVCTIGRHANESPHSGPHSARISTACSASAHRRCCTVCAAGISTS